MEIKRINQIVVTGTDEELDAVEQAISAIGSLVTGSDKPEVVTETADPTSVNAIFKGGR